MRKLSIRIKVLNFFRKIFKIWPFDTLLLSALSHQTTYSIAKKCVPNNYQFSEGTLKKVKRNGINYELDISQYIEHLIYYKLEAESKQKLYGLVKNKSNILDVGVNIGETVLSFSRINPGGQIYGFEPVPFLFEKAIRNISLNQKSNINLFNLALSDQNGQLSFDMAKNLNSGSISMNKDLTKGSMIVNAVTLDNFVQEHNITDIDLIKIDVEGFELNVLKGAQNVLRTAKPVLFVEVVDTYLKRQNVNASMLIRYLQDLGYSINDAKTNDIIQPDQNFSNTHLDIICHPS